MSIFLHSHTLFHKYSVKYSSNSVTTNSTKQVRFWKSLKKQRHWVQSLHPAFFMHIPIKFLAGKKVIRFYFAFCCDQYWCEKFIKSIKQILEPRFLVTCWAWKPWTSIFESFGGFYDCCWPLETFWSMETFIY